MVKHIVFFSLLEEAEGKTKLENAQIIKAGLDNLLGKVPSLRAASCGINIPNAPKTNYDLALVCEFDDWAGLDAYQIHPEHVAVASYIGKCKKDRAAVDWEYTK